MQDDPTRIPIQRTETFPDQRPPQRPANLPTRRTENYDVPSRQLGPGRPALKPSGQRRGYAAVLGGAALVAYAVYKTSSRPHRDQRRLISPPPPQKQAAAPTEIDASVTIGKPAAEIYNFWRNLENLPRFMKNLESVRDVGNGRSHWVAKSPVGGAPVEWDAEIVEERDGELISWRSLPDSTIHNSGNVRFEPATGGRGTFVKVHLDLVPPGGVVGRLAASLLEPVTVLQVKEDLRRLKNLLEAGEIPTTEGQPEGRRPLINPRNPL